MKQRVVVGWLVIGMLCCSCSAADPVDTSVARFASAIGVATNAQARNFVVRPFPSNQVTRVAGFTLRRKAASETTPAASLDIDVVDSNKQVVATGRICECASFDLARKELLVRLVSNSLPLDVLTAKYEVRSSEVGDLCIIEKTFDKSSRTFAAVPAMVHFVRGGTIVSLYPVETGADISTIARTIDTVLLNPLGDEQERNRK